MEWIFILRYKPFKMSSETDSEPEESAEGAPKERLVTAAGLLLVAFLTILDLIEDRLEGAHLPHLLTEAAIVVAATLGALYLLRKYIRRSRSEHRQLYLEMIAARDDAKRWREKSGEILSGLGQAIEEQFNQWNLTDSEKEVGMLLLKGLAHKEIANIRNTSEKTVRQHATSVYAKASLESRAQLSAYFLEDLLLPSEKNF